MARRQFERIALSSAERSARKMFAAVEAGRRRVLVGLDAKLIEPVSRLPAGLYQRPLVAGIRRRVSS